MRFLPTLLATAVLSTTASAQIDMNAIMGQQGMKAEDDNDPFVPNAFVGSFRMEVHHYTGTEENKGSPTNMHYWSNTDMTVVKTEMPDSKTQDVKMLTDLKGKWQYMLMTDEKGGKTAMKSRKKKITVEQKPGSGKEPEVTITDETRTIEGHVCRKVIVKSEDGTWTGWVAEDVPTPFADMARHVKTGDPRMMDRMTALKGCALEFEWVDANGKDRTVCYVRDLAVGKVDPAVFSLDGYEVMEMPAFGR